MISRRADLEAEEIAHDILCRTGLGFKCDRSEIAADCYLLPQTMETVEGVRVVRSLGDIQRVYAEVNRYFDSVGVVDLVRTVVEACFVEDGKIETTHVSSLLKAGGVPFRAPYPVFSVLKLCNDGKWRVASSSYAIIDSREHSEALLTWQSKDGD